ncbi:hypothetical protein MKI84_09490 [Ancylobacter sp. A5.8]|uniref:hypothetical protein n=1 Tax=Ancylobacter gelatini TaxID=2919920 RepID=UPI001F4E8150|nr:hypothetical protein [Ancylobacter gelatini]MCJ8143152.1 hypothetical protein [Ancylobacter gelatini]
MLYWTILIVGCLIIAAMIRMQRNNAKPGSWLLIVAVAGGVLWLASLVDTPSYDEAPGIDREATSVPPSGYQALPPPTEDYEQPAAPR